MNRDTALEVLTRSKPILASRFGVARPALFGSTARTSLATTATWISSWLSMGQRPRSVISAFSSTEDRLQRPVDLVTEKALRPELRPYIEQEAVNV